MEEKVAKRGYLEYVTYLMSFYTKGKTEQEKETNKIINELIAYDEFSIFQNSLKIPTSTQFTKEQEIIEIIKQLRLSSELPENFIKNLKNLISNFKNKDLALSLTDNQLIKLIEIEDYKHAINCFTNLKLSDQVNYFKNFNNCGTDSQSTFLIILQSENEKLFESLEKIVKFQQEIDNKNYAHANSLLQAYIDNKDFSDIIFDLYNYSQECNSKNSKSPDEFDLFKQKITEKISEIYKIAKFNIQAEVLTSTLLTDDLSLFNETLVNLYNDNDRADVDFNFIQDYLSKMYIEQNNNLFFSEIKESFCEILSCEILNATLQGNSEKLELIYNNPLTLELIKNIKEKNSIDTIYYIAHCLREKIEINYNVELKRVLQKLFSHNFVNNELGNIYNSFKNFSDIQKEFFMYAVESGHEKFVEFILNEVKYSEIEEENSFKLYELLTANNNAALVSAIQSGNLPIVKTILKAANKLNILYSILESNNCEIYNSALSSPNPKVLEIIDKAYNNNFTETDLSQLKLKEFKNDLKGNIDKANINKNAPLDDYRGIVKKSRAFASSLTSQHYEGSAFLRLDNKLKDIICNYAGLSFKEMLDLRKELNKDKANQI